MSIAATVVSLTPHGDQRKVLTFLLLPLDASTTYVVQTTTCVVFFESAEMDSMSIKRLLASELEILDVLWTKGPLSIVEVQREMTGSPAYTSVQTRLNRMHEKGLLERSDGRPAKYTSAIARKFAAAKDLKLLVDNVSDGQIVPLVAQLVNQRPLSRQELDEIRAIIEQAENRAQNKQGKTK